MSSVTLRREIEPRAPRLRAALACVLSAVLAGPALAGSDEADTRPAGDRSFSPAPAFPDQVRIARRDRAQALIDLTYPRPQLAIALELEDAGAVLGEGRRFDVTARSDRPAVMLLLGIDRTGVVSVLYPLEAAELAPASSLRATCEAVAPFGSEVLKLFAFHRTPTGLGQWIGRQIDPLDPDFDRLLRLLSNPGTEGAETRLEVFTAGARAAGEPVGAERRTEAARMRR